MSYAADRSTGVGASARSQLFGSASDQAVRPRGDPTILPFKAKELPRRAKLTFDYLLAAVVVAECLAVFVVASVVSATYVFYLSRHWRFEWGYVLASGFVATTISIIALATKQYASIQLRSCIKFLRSGVATAAVAYSFLLAALFLLKFADAYSRVTFFVQFLCVAITICIIRAAAQRAVRFGIASGRVQKRRVFLVGDGSSCADLAQRLSVDGITTIGRYALERRRLNPDRGRREPLHHVAVDLISAECRHLLPDDVILLIRSDDFSAFEGLARELSKLPVAVHLVVPDKAGLLATASISELGPLRAIQVLRQPLALWERSLKRALDLVLATTGLIVLAPLLVAVSIAIKLNSSGPVLFRQTRHGFNNRRIQIIKFRTMRVAECGTQFAQVKRSDPRVTAVGRVLRCASIDELPQLVNVLRGEMSIVGPRPHAIAHNEMYFDKIAPLSRRHNVKPGLTGWAQVNGARGETNTLEKMRKRIDLDLYYIDNWSVWFDLKIIALTMFSRRAYINAY
jgi:Undecaprenyl-phosphate glucose phosphotransferase